MRMLPLFDIVMRQGSYSSLPKGVFQRGWKFLGTPCLNDQFNLLRLDQSHDLNISFACLNEEYYFMEQNLLSVNFVDSKTCRK